MGQRTRYSQTIRVLRCMIELRGGGWLTVGELGARLGVGARTVRRDILVLEELGAPLESTKVRNSKHANQHSGAVEYRLGYRLMTGWVEKILGLGGKGYGLERSDRYRSGGG